MPKVKSNFFIFLNNWILTINHLGRLWYLLSPLRISKWPEHIFCETLTCSTLHVVFIGATSHANDILFHYSAIWSHLGEIAVSLDCAEIFNVPEPKHKPWQVPSVP